MSSSQVSNSHVLRTIASNIDRTISTYHNHSKSCRQCRAPKATYESRLPKNQRCPDGIALTSQLMAQLYLRAEYEPKGTFRVCFKEGWYEIDELIKVICHNNQGEYTTKVVDLKRAKPQSPPQMLIESSRGSGYEEDMRRHQKAARLTPSPQYVPAVPVNIPRPSHPARSSGMLEVHPDPRDAYPSPASSPAGSYVSGKSVHFAPRVQVREFDE